MLLASNCMLLAVIDHNMVKATVIILALADTAVPDHCGQPQLAVKYC